MCLTPNGRLLRFVLPSLSPAGHSADQLDLSHGHHPCIDRDAVVVNADYRHSLCRRHPTKKPAVVKWMDRTTGCLFLLFAAKLAHESAVVTQGGMPCFAIKMSNPWSTTQWVKRSGSNVRLASFFCKTMTIIGVPDAVIAHTANSVSIFCSAMRWSGNKKQTGKMRQSSSDTSWMSVMKRIPLVACYQETESSPPTMTPDDCKAAPRK